MKKKMTDGENLVMFMMGALLGAALIDTVIVVVLFFLHRKRK